MERKNGKETADDSSNYGKAHSSFKKEFLALRRSVNGTNRYSMHKIVGKLNIFEADGEKGGEPSPNGGLNRYSVRRIIGSNGLTRLKENKSSYAIGDKDGKPITGFDYIFVPYRAEGANNGFVEVITKDGDLKRFNCDTYELTECIGVGTVGAGAVVDGGSADGSSDGNNAISSADDIQYKDLEKEMLLPTKQNIRFIAGGYPFSRVFLSKRKRGKRRG